MALGDSHLQHPTVAQSTLGYELSPGALKIHLESLKANSAIIHEGLLGLSFVPTPFCMVQ